MPAARSRGLITVVLEENQLVRSIDRCYLCAAIGVDMRSKRKAIDEALTISQRTANGTVAKDGTWRALLQAAQDCLCETGYAGLSTRRVAEMAQVPLSQIHYHFGSKQGLLLALLADQNERLLNRQAATFSENMPLSRRWERACDYLDEDLSSGYVRVLQEMITAGWSDPLVAAAVRKNLQDWYELLTNLAREAGDQFGGLGPFSASEVASLVGNAFIGSEAMILLGLENSQIPARASLRKFGQLIRLMEGGGNKSVRPKRRVDRIRADKKRPDK